MTMGAKAARAVLQFGEQEALCVAPDINPGPVESSFLAGCSRLHIEMRKHCLVLLHTR